MTGTPTDENIYTPEKLTARSEIEVLFDYCQENLFITEIYFKIFAHLLDDFSRNP
jgi:hypothetical protein